MVHHQVLGRLALALAVWASVTGCGTLVVDGFQTEDAGAESTSPVVEPPVVEGGYKALVMRQSGAPPGIIFYFNNVPQSCEQPAVIPLDHLEPPDGNCLSEAVYEFVYSAPLSFIQMDDAGSGDMTTSYCMSAVWLPGCRGGGGGGVVAGGGGGLCQESLEILAYDGTTMRVRLTGATQVTGPDGQGSSGVWTLDGEHDVHICGSLFD